MFRLSLIYTYGKNTPWYVHVGELGIYAMLH